MKQLISKKKIPGTLNKQKKPKIRRFLPIMMCTTVIILLLVPIAGLFNDTIMGVGGVSPTGTDLQRLTEALTTLEEINEVIIHKAGSNGGEEVLDGSTYNLIISDPGSYNEINLTSAITINRGISIKAASDTITLKMSAPERHFIVISGGTLCLGSDTGTLLIDGDRSSFSDSYGGGIQVSSGGSLELGNGAEIRNNHADNGGGVQISDGIFTMSGGIISQNKSSSGAGVIVKNSNFIMTGGAINDNSGTLGSVGGGVRLDESTFDMSGTASIRNNSSGKGGGGVSINNSTFTMSGGEISANTVDDNGGGVDVNDRGTFIMTGGSIGGKSDEDGNIAKIGGGVCVFNGSEFIMEGGTISRNSAGTGAAVNVNGSFIMSDGIISYSKSTAVQVERGHFTMKDGAISNNVSPDDSGGLRIIEGGVFDMEGGTISDNTVVIEGGGVSVSGENSRFNMLSSTALIKNNHAREGGGVATMHGGVFTIKAGTISGNTAFGYNSKGGGGIFVGIAGKLIIEDGVISGNKAPNAGSTSFERGKGGGISIISEGSFTMTGGMIKGNEAGFGGGGVYNQGGKFVFENGTINGNIAEKNGGGLFYDNSRVDFNMYNGTIGGSSPADGNIAEVGAGVFMSSGSFTMHDGMISNNGTTLLTQKGGGVYIGGNFTMLDGFIEKNTVSSEGGGVHAETFIMESGTISGNQAINTTAEGGNGGGVYAKSVIMRDGIIGGTTIAGQNHASQDGGGIFNQRHGTITVQGGAISGNRADRNGGGVFVYDYANATVSPKVVFSANVAGRGPFWLEDYINSSVYTTTIGTSMTVSMLKTLHNGHNLPEYPVMSKSSQPEGITSIIDGLPEFGYLTNNYDLNFDATAGPKLIGRTVTFEPNGGKFPTSNSNEALIVGINHNTVLGASKMPENPTRPGYLFAGWYEKNTRIDESTLVNRDILATAEWISGSGAQLKKEYVKTLYPESDPGKVHIHYTIDYALPENIHLADNLIITDENDSKLKLIGGGVNISLGSEKMDMTGISVSSGSFVRIVIPCEKFTSDDVGKKIKISLRFRADETITGAIINSSKVFINIFDKERFIDPEDPDDTKVILYVVTFDANGGSYSDGMGSKSQIVEHGKAATAPSSLPARFGYIFVRWDKEFLKITSPLLVKAEWTREVMINDVYEDDDVITGTGEPGKNIDVTIPREDDDGIVLETKVNDDGTWTVDVPDDVILKPGDKITAEMKEPETNDMLDTDDTIIKERPIEPPQLPETSPPPVTPQLPETSPPPVTPQLPATPQSPTAPSSSDPTQEPLQTLPPSTEPDSIPELTQSQPYQIIMDSPQRSQQTSSPPTGSGVPEFYDGLETPDNKPDNYLKAETLEQIENAGNPIITMGNLAVPLFASNQLSSHVWALWNLILSVAGVVLAAMTGIRVLIREKNEDEECAGVRHRNEKARKTGHNKCLLLSIPALAIAAIILFLLTQNMRNLMVMVDWWTIIHIVLFVAAVICSVFAFRKKKDEVDSYSTV